ncbi:MAG: cyclic nucleotide-binding domain-containing protein [Thermodesulfobacteria bacterium]|nr:cyclic nucleotide-binding domain-containing protein [Thermodesulfobacteriota bacterium]
MKSWILWSFIFRKPEELEFLKNNLIFKGLSQKELNKAIEFLHKRSYRKGENIVSFGEPGFALYIIVSGKVDVLVPGNSSEKDSFVKVDTLERGEFFGEMALVTESFRTATIKCVEDTEVYVLTRSALENLIECQPEIASKVLYNIAGVIAERLKKLNEQLMSQ